MHNTLTRDEAARIVLGKLGYQSKLCKDGKWSIWKRGDMTKYRRGKDLRALAISVARETQ